MNPKVTPELAAQLLRHIDMGLRHDSDCVTYVSSSGATWTSMHFIDDEGRRRSVGIHHLILMRAGRTVSSGQIVKRTCGNPTCLNPAHLNVTTHSELMHLINRSGLTKGEGNGRANLTTQQATVIRNAPAHVPTRKLADEYGVSIRAVQDIRAGRRWAHLSVS